MNTREKILAEVIETLFCCDWLIIKLLQRLTCTEILHLDVTG